MRGSELTAPVQPSTSPNIGNQAYGGLRYGRALS